MNKGQSLFEVVLALALATLILVVIVSLASNSIRNTTFSKRKTVASRYAQKITEWLRGERDKSWDDFRKNSIAISCPSSPHTQCLDSEPFAWGDCGSCDDDELVDGIYKREISFECRIISATDKEGSIQPCLTLAVNAIHATIEVSWEDAQGPHIIRSVTTFSDWRSLPTPEP